MNIVVLMGGSSAERAISLRTGSGIARALRARGHEVTALDPATGAVLLPGAEEAAAALPEGATALAPRESAALLEARSLQGAELVFLALHGGAGEDGTIQALLDLAGKTYTGSGMLASAMAMDKAVSKKIFEHAGIPTPAWRLYRRREGLVPDDAMAQSLGGYPLVVKPNDEGSTFGLSIVDDAKGLAPAYEEALRYSNQVLVEAFIPGRELTVAVLGEQVLPIVEIKPRSGLYDYESKYTAGKSEYFCPADLDAAKTSEVQELSLRACRALDTAGVARVDFRLAPDGTPYCLEVNTIPGMTPTSLVPMAAKAVGLSFEDVCERVAALALERAQKERRPGAPRATPGAA
jgi:D-alanine-D-alanine ligase